MKKFVILILLFLNYSIFFSITKVYLMKKTYKYTFSILLNTKNFNETLPGESKIEIDDDGNE